MKKYIALRMRSLRDAKLGVEHSQATLIRVLSNSMEPALRNLVEGLQKRGLAAVVDGCDLYWFLIEDDKNCDHYKDFNEVEACFGFDWFEEQKNAIRYLSGIEYCEACEKLIADWPIKDSQRKIEYRLPQTELSEA